MNAKDKDDNMREMPPRRLSRRQVLAMAGIAAVEAALPRNLSAVLPEKRRPNIIYILADDLGYGDVSCLNRDRGKIPTPNIDRLASQGITFTDAHSGSAVCTPARYGILTGRYSWRTRLQEGIVPVYGKPLISRDRLTVAGFLRKHGYHTACIGKWHLGWSWQKNGDDIRFDQPVGDGPITRGFDYYFGVDVPNWPPYCFIENDRTVGVPSEPVPIKVERPRTISIAGPAVPGWKLENILPTLTDKACSYIADRAKDRRPFFLYFPLTSPHTPLAVNKEWLGKSGLHLYADFVMETDAMVGRVMEALEKHGLSEDTLVIFTSDNGCAHYIGVDDMEKKGHYPSAHFRGYKFDAWDGGHRIPFIARWPGIIKPESKCDYLTCLTDLMATCADVVGEKLPDNSGEDSISILPLLRGGSRPVRESVVHHSSKGRFAVREGRWKLLLCPGSGGSNPPDTQASKKSLPPVQLYDMQADPGETTNLQDKHPKIVDRLTKLLEEQVTRGRSTVGPPQKNDVEVDIKKTSQS